MRYSAVGMMLALLLALYGCSGAQINEGMTPDGRAYRGAAAPKLIIYEYSDFQCPFCGKVQPTLEEVLRAYPNDVQLQFRNNPLETHPQAYGAALAGVCAEEQGKFWPMHDRMFASQGALYESDLKEYASELGLDSQKFSQCLGSAAAGAKVESDLAEGASIVRGTPTFRIGQSAVIGSQPFSKFKAVIDSELAGAG